MFVLRSLFWVSTLVMLLPPSGEGQPAPRLSLLQAAYATRVLAQDLTGVCERNPAACATSREALLVLTRKLETGVGIVSTGIDASQALADPADRGTLQPADLEPAWHMADLGT
jgi:hypothetical protein